MKKFVIVASFSVLIIGVALFYTRQEKPKAELWAGMSVSQPVFQNGWTKNLQINCAIVNDSNTTINPIAESSHLFINGKELEDWNFIIRASNKTRG